jgi:3-deoxy-D-manno-octulosonate 8-phosphate phosphatase (KDO 8-P phosphatase)
MKLEERCQKIEMILADVDGVLTDGHVVFDNQGIETKHFHIRDGMGIKLWQRAGYRFGLITGRSSHIVKIRAAELGIDIVRQTAEDKLPAMQEILRQTGVEPAQVCYIGDDLPDLPVIRAVGLGVAVADACPEARAAAQYVTSRGGGRGAVRETIELVLKAQHRWDELLQRY